MRPEPAVSDTALDRLVGVLRGAGVQLVSKARGSVVPTGSCIYDPNDPHTIAAGDVVLGINLHGDQTESLIRDGARAGAAAVALKAGDGKELDDFLESAAVPVLLLPPDLAWSQLQALVASALSATVAVESDGADYGDLFALSNAVAARVGGAVTLEDPNFNLLAYSNLDHPIDDARRETILGRGNSSRWAKRLEEEGIPRTLKAMADGVLRIADPGGETRDRVVAPVRAGHELLGFIWVVRGDRPLDADTEAALLDVVAQVARHLLRHRSYRDVGRRERGKTFREFLDGRPWDDELTRALGLEPSGACCVIAFSLDFSSSAATIRDEVELSVKRIAAIDMITLTSEAFRRQVICAWIGSTVYALFPMMTPSSTTRLGHLVDDICRRANTTLGIEMRAGLGSVVDRLSGAGTSRAEADKVLRVLDTEPQESRGLSAAFEDVRTESMVLSVVDLLKARADLRLPALDLVISHDVEHSSAYLVTLRSYIDHFGDVAATGKGLGVHPNTVRYRIRRIEQIAQLNLGDPKVRLAVSLDLLVRSSEGANG